MQNKYIYRIVRLRRLFVLSLCLVFACWLVGFWLFGASILLGSFGSAATVALLCSMIMIGMLLYYPSAWWENLCTALVLGMALMLLPVLEILPSMAPERNREMATITVVVVPVFGFFFLWLGLNWLPQILPTVPSRDFKHTARAVWDMPAEKAFELLKYKPNSDDGFYRTGDIGADGFFWYETCQHWFNADNYEPEVIAQTHRCKIELEEGLEQSGVVLGDVGDRTISAVFLVSVQHSGDRSVCVIKEISTGLFLSEQLGFWLRDFGTDYLHSRIARLGNTTSLAIRDLPYRSPLVTLAKFFAQSDEQGRHRF